MKLFLLLYSLVLFISCSNEVLSSHQKNSSKKTYKERNTSKIIQFNNHIIYRNYTQALKRASQENKPIFILFYTENCQWCIKLKKTTLQDKELIHRLKEEYITLYLNKNSDKYPSSFKLNALPKIYITTKDGEKFTSISGYHKNPKDYIKWFNYVQVELKH